MKLSFQSTPGALGHALPRPAQCTPSALAGAPRAVPVSSVRSYARRRHMPLPGRWQPSAVPGIEQIATLITLIVMLWCTATILWMLVAT